MSETQPCLHRALKQFALGEGKGLESEGIAVMGNAAFCDRLKCEGSYEIANGTLHNKCKQDGLAEEGTKKAEATSRILTSKNDRHPDDPAPVLHELGIRAIASTQLFTGSASGEIIVVDQPLEKTG
jgi:hypothetical protein